MIPRDLPSTAETWKSGKRWSFDGWQTSYRRKPERLRNKGILHMNWLHSIWGAERTLFVLLWVWKWNVNAFSAQVTLLAIELYFSIGLCGSNPAADRGRGGNAALPSFRKRLFEGPLRIVSAETHGSPTFCWGNSGPSLCHTQRFLKSEILNFIGIERWSLGYRAERLGLPCDDNSYGKSIRNCAWCVWHGVQHR